MCPALPLHALYSDSLYLNPEVVQVLPNVGGVNDALEGARAGVLMDLTETTKALFNFQTLWSFFASVSLITGHVLQTQR